MDLQSSHFDALMNQLQLLKAEKSAKVHTYPVTSFYGNLICGRNITFYLVETFKGMKNIDDRIFA